MSDPPGERPVGLGVVGCGVIGRQHIAAAVRSDNASVVALCDVNPAAAQAAAEDHDIDTWYTDAAEIVEDERVEAVVLALPAGVRQPIALAAFAAGKHLLIEKPAGLNATQVRELLVAQGDLVAGCCTSRMRHLPSARAAAACIESGALGQIRMMRARGITPAPGRPATLPPAWRLSTTLNGGGIMANWGCYDLDYLLGITGWQIRPEVVFAAAWPIAAELRHWVAAGSDAETHVAALARCSGGTVLALERGEYLPGQRDAAWEVIGTRGSLRLVMPPRVGKSVCLEQLDERGVTSCVLWQGDEDYELVSTALIDDFAVAVRTAGAPLTNLAQALLIQEVTDAIYKSAHSGSEVFLPPEE